MPQVRTTTAVSTIETKSTALAPDQLFFSGGIENSNVRQRHRLGEHVGDEKFIFHVVLAVVGADHLGLVNRNDEDYSRPVALRGRSG